MHVQPGTLARSLLSSALDEADPDAATSSSARRHPGRPRAGASQARREAKSGAVAGAGPMPACWSLHRSTRPSSQGWSSGCLPSTSWT